MQRGVLSVKEQGIETPWRVTEHPAEQRGLATMMSGMDRRVPEDLRHSHRIALGSCKTELHDAGKVGIGQRRQKVAAVTFHFAREFHDRLNGRVIIGIEASASLRAATAMQPTPFGADHVNQYDS